MFDEHNWLLVPEVENDFVTQRIEDIARSYGFGTERLGHNVIVKGVTAAQCDALWSKFGHGIQ